MMSKYLKFTKANAKKAKRFIGTRGWFYSKPELFAREDFNPLYLDRLIAIDLTSDKPFKISMDEGWFPFFVVPNPKALLVEANTLTNPPS